MSLFIYYKIVLTGTHKIKIDKIEKSDARRHYKNVDDVL